MRRVRYCVAMSLDGYIAGPEGQADWIVMDPEIASGFGDFFTQFDTMLIGRKTFDAMGGRGGGGSGPFAGYRVIVVSTTLATAPRGVTVLAHNVRETIDGMRRESGKDIWLFGGGELFASLLAMGVVDSVEVAVIPVLLGAGRPLLPPPTARASLKLAQHRVYPTTGTVSLSYDVTPTRSAAGRRPRAPKGPRPRP